jgi:hypothetical protein
MSSLVRRLLPPRHSMRAAPSIASALLLIGLTKASLAQPPVAATPPGVAVHTASPATGATRVSPTAKPLSLPDAQPRAALPTAIALHAPEVRPAAPPVKVRWITAAARAVADAGLQVGGTLVGLGEKALGRHAPNVTGAYHPVEVNDPNGTRQLVVFRSNQPKSTDDIATFVDLARQRGVTDRSQILFVNLRAEKDEDRSLISEYEAGLGSSAGPGRIRQLDLKIIDNSPPAFYVGNLGWKRAVNRVRTVYDALQDPTVKVAVIHCEEGDGRTGEIVATAVRVAMDNMSEGDALAEATQHGLTMPWQRAFVSRFAREWHDGTIRF